MRYKLNNIDIVLLVKELNENLKDLRLNNIYDMNNKNYLIKFDLPKENLTKVQKELNVNNKLFLNYNHSKYIYLDSNPSSERKTLPNTFCQKLKEKTKNKRIVEVFQPNYDKIVIIGFGFSESEYYLIFEFFGSGNMILTNNEYNILTLIRFHDYDEDNRVRVNNKYVFPIMDEKYIPIAIKENLNLKNFEIKNNEINFVDEDRDETFLICLNNYLKEIENIKTEEKPKKDKNSIENKLEKNIKNIDNKIKNLANENNKMLLSNEFIEENLCYLEKIYDYLNDENNLLFPKKVYSLNFEILSYECKTEKIKKEIRKIKLVKIKYLDYKLKFDLNLSLFENLNNFYSLIKQNTHKIERSKFGKENVIKDYDNKGNFKKFTENIKINIPIKMDCWFQKYNWSISNNKFLIVAGKTADQNEELVKKHLDPNDIYLHAEISGMPSTIIKNLRNFETDTNLFIKVLEDANHLAVLRSKCWKEKFSGRCYWVYPEQVSKTTESGEYITKGSFIIRGKRNILSSVSMELAFGIYLVIDINKFEFTENISECKYVLLNISPYRNLKNNKFCVKIKPGSMKRNKVFMNIMKNNIKKFSNDTEIVNFIKSINITNADILPSNIC
jgi:predicted ribosome quality control (RQC) complex YloA/Tae2 family protein